MIADLLKDTILSYAHDLKPSTNGWMTCDCPMCLTMGETKDTRGRFGIIFSHDGSFGANCFNCHYTIRWEVGTLISQKLSSYFEMIGVSESDIRELRFAAHREKENIINNEMPEISQVVRRTWSERELPEGSRSLRQGLEDKNEDPDFLAVCQYAMQRGIYDFDNVYWSDEPLFQYKRRLIIPFTNYGKIVGHTGRFIGNNKRVPKYYNDMPENYVHNMDAQTYERTNCILCEGVIDATLTSGISCLGNSINNKQIEVINSLKKNIILCPDRDDSGDPTIEVAIANGWGVSFPKWEDDIKDAADAVQRYGRLMTVKSIMSSVIYNPLKIHVARKFDNYIGKEKDE